MRDHVLVAGIGNIFLGDDGFGPEVVRRLAEEGMPPGTRVVDYGIRGMHLAYDLLDPWDLVVLVDALPDRGSPGRLEALELTAASGGLPRLDAHGMDPAAVLASLSALGGTLPRTILVGVQVRDVTDGMGLTPGMQAAVPAAVAAVQELVDEADRSCRLGTVTAGRPARGV
jgi:hydrogenase maturation protease